LLTRPVRIAAFDYPFCIPDALLRDEQFAADAGLVIRQPTGTCLPDQLDFMPEQA